MQKTEEERFLMGMSMCHAVRQVVMSSLADAINDSEKKVRFLYRYYSHDLSKEELKNIEKWLMRGEQFVNKGRKQKAEIRK